MKSLSSQAKRGFTLIELLVVMAIMAIMMCMAGSVLRDTGTGRGIESGVDMLQSLVEEAQATAIGNNTPTRLVIVSDPDDTSPDSRHLRYMVVQMQVRKGEKAGSYDGTDVVRGGTVEWKSTSAGVLLPPGVYFCPKYSRALGWKGRGSGNLIGESYARLSRRGQSKVYTIEFDEKGRFVGPDTSPNHQPVDLRLVLINGRLTGRSTDRALDGVIPTSTDRHGRPMGAKGILLSPNGEVSLLRNDEQIFEE